MSLVMWWPTPEALQDLTFEQTDEGYTLEAPPGTECATWLSFWGQSEEHLEFFNEQFSLMLTAYLETINGQTEVQPLEQDHHREQAQEDCPGLLS